MSEPTNKPLPPSLQVAEVERRLQENLRIIREDEAQLRLILEMRRLRRLAAKAASAKESS